MSRLANTAAALILYLIAIPALCVAVIFAAIASAAGNAYERLGDKPLPKEWVEEEWE